METVKIAFCIVCCSLLPILWGSMFCFIIEQVKKQSHVKQEVDRRLSCAGWSVMGTILYLFGMFWAEFLVKHRGWSLHRLTIISLVYAGVLTGVWLLVCLKKSYHSYVKQALKEVFDRSGWPVILVCAIGYLLIAMVYVIGGFRLEVYHVLPEDASMVYGNGFLIADDYLSGFYAHLAMLWKIRIEHILFGVMPFVWLCVYLTGIVYVASILLDKKSAVAWMTAAFVVLLLFGDTTHMGLAYMILHAPYEGDALLGGIAAIALAGVILQGLKEAGWICRGVLLLQVIMLGLVGFFFMPSVMGIGLMVCEAILLSFVISMMRYRHHKVPGTNGE